MHRFPTVRSCDRALSGIAEGLFQVQKGEPAPRIGGCLGLYKGSEFLLARGARGYPNRYGLDMEAEGDQITRSPTSIARGACYNLGPGWSAEIDNRRADAVPAAAIVQVCMAWPGRIWRPMVRAGAGTRDPVTRQWNGGSARWRWRPSGPPPGAEAGALESLAN
jgi:hypothetical protein